jgi:hypothetical protein
MQLSFLKAMTIVMRMTRTRNQYLRTELTVVNSLSVSRADEAGRIAAIATEGWRRLRAAPVRVMLTKSVCGRRAADALPT